MVDSEASKSIIPLLLIRKTTMDARSLILDVGGCLYYGLIDAICFAVLYGIFLLAAIIAILLLISPKEGDLKSRQRLLLILFTIILFIINTADFVNTPAPAFVESREALMMTLSGGIAQQVEVAENVLNRWQVISAWPTTIELCISDMLVVWRAIVVWTGNEWVKWGLVAVTVFDIGINFTNGAISDILSLRGSPIQTKINAAAMAVSLGINLVATALVGLKFWQYRNLLHNLLGEHRPTEVQKILLLLVESGGIFLLVQTALVVMMSIELKDGAVPLVVGDDVMSQIFEEMCVLYPIAVIIMIHCRNSLLNMTVHYEETRTHASSSAMVRTQD